MWTQKVCFVKNRSITTICVPLMAEEQGFEPWEGVNLRRFSRPVHSTTLPLLRRTIHNCIKLILKVVRLTLNVANHVRRAFHIDRKTLR